MLRLEQLGHLRAAAFQSNNPDQAYGPDYHRHVACWLEEVINGALQNYSEQASEALKTEEEKSTTLTEQVAEGRLQAADSGGEYLKQ